MSQLVPQNQGAVIWVSIAFHFLVVIDSLSHHGTSANGAYVPFSRFVDPALPYARLVTVFYCGHISAKSVHLQSLGKRSLRESFTHLKMI